MNLEDYNLHWLKGYSYDFPLKRDMFDTLNEGVDKKWIEIITGLRRTGKTTLMKQVIDTLIGRGVDPGNILYFSFDEPESDIRTVIRDYEKKIGKRLATSDEFHYIFLDEVQKTKNWAEQVKYYYDQFKNIKLYLSGSASLFIRMGTRESLAGRTREMLLPPLNFREYLLFSDKLYMAEKPSMYEDNLKTEFESYLLRQFVDIVNEDEKTVAQYVKSIIEKVVYIDIPYIYKIENPEVLLSIVKTVSSTPGMLLEYNSLANNLGINRGTISDYVHYLSQSYLLKIGYNYSKSAIKSERKQKKGYLSTPTFSSLYSRSLHTSKLVEWHFFTDPGIDFFWRTPRKDEVDIIKTKNDVPTPIEVKYRKTIRGQETKSMQKFMRKFGVEKGILITKDLERTKTCEEGKIEYIPAWKMALKE